MTLICCLLQQLGSGACNCALFRGRERAQRRPPCVGIVRKGARIEFRSCWNIERPKRQLQLSSVIET
jgi:hypothetical protein